MAVHKDMKHLLLVPTRDKIFGITELLPDSVQQSISSVGIIIQ